LGIFVLLSGLCFGGQCVGIALVLCAAASPIPQFRASFAASMPCRLSLVASPDTCRVLDVTPDACTFAIIAERKVWSLRVFETFDSKGSGDM
jgi:hypothetical protein